MLHLFPLKMTSHNDTSGGKKNTWYLDTGLSNHMSRKRSMFVKLNESVNGNIIFGDDSNASVKEKGNILFRTKDDSCQINFE